MKMRWGRFRKIHMVGIGGAGMSALAEILLDDGIEVSGCDTTPSPRLESLRDRGALIYTEHHRSHLKGVDAVITTPALPSNHPEIDEAKRKGHPIITRAEMLGEALRDTNLIAVAGTHGKTTTSAILAHMLEECGTHPTVALGGVHSGKGRAGWRGTGKLAVCEADEYNRSFLDLRPLHTILTNVEAEHLDYFKSEAEVHRAFHTFLEMIPPQGSVLVCGEDAAAQNAAGGLRAEILSYGLGPESELRAHDLGRDRGLRRFSVDFRGRHLGEVHLPLAGRHNVLNSLSALGAGLLAGISFERLSIAITTFPGVSRRFEILGESRGILFIDDYAHHPTELRAVIAAAREYSPERRLVVLFQPHLFSRTQQFARDFAMELAGADQAIVLPIFAAREDAAEGVSHQLILDELEGAGGRTHDGLSLEDLPSILETICHPGDLLLTTGAGNIGAWVRAYLKEGT